MYKFDIYEQLPITLTNEHGDKVVIDRNSTVIEEIAYWRKANAIHKWFVDNCNNGDVDCNCTDIFVSKDSLLCLLEDCKKVLKNKNKANEILPTCSGFFFGTLDYDECYYEDIKLTIKQIKKIIKDYPNDGYFYYEASW